MHDRLELLEGRQVFGIGVDERHDHERNALLRGRDENRLAHVLNQLEEPRRPKVEHRPRHIDGRVIVEQPAVHLRKQRLRRRQLPRRRRAMQKHQLHAATPSARGCAARIRPA
jgi:hypothetical protein